MNFYKVIKDNEIISVLRNPVWVRRGRNGLTMRCDAQDACGVVADDDTTIWQIDGTPIVFAGSESVGVADITQQEYDELCVLLGMDGTVYDRPLSVEWPQEAPAEQEDVVSLILESARERKIEMLKEQCQQAIICGVDVVLGDGSTQHFGMTVNDQSNMQDALLQVLNGAQSVLYHASGQPLCYFDKSDIFKIHDAMLNHKAQHMARMESIELWAIACSSVIEIGDITYDAIIPDKFQSDAYQNLMV